MFADIAHFAHFNHAHHLVSLYSFTEDDTSGNVFDSDSYSRDNTIKGTEWPGQQGHISPDMVGVPNQDLGYTSIGDTSAFVTSYCPFDGQDADSNHWCSSFTTVDSNPFYGKGI